MCSEFLSKFRNQSMKTVYQLSDVVTWDESWFYWRQIGREQSNASWVAEGENPRTVVDRFEPKTMVSIIL